MEFKFLFLVQHLIGSIIYFQVSFQRTPEVTDFQRLAEGMLVRSYYIEKEKKNHSFSTNINFSRGKMLIKSM